MVWLVVGLSISGIFMIIQGLIYTYCETGFASRLVLIKYLMPGFLVLMMSGAMGIGWIIWLYL